MTISTPTMEYRYESESCLEPVEGGAELRFATFGGTVPEVSGGLQQVAAPYFFSGFLEHPDVVAAALLVVARVSRTRFYTPPNVTAAVLRAADPVVTSTAEGLRFEAFSVCCGVHVRLDVLADGLDAQYTATGVTNVDVNPPLREALAGLRAREPLHMRVGSDELAVTTLDGSVSEARVPLPVRWCRGFAEAQFLSAGMVLRHEMDVAAARRFVQGLPRSSSVRTVLWATPGVGVVRLASTPGPGTVCLAGPERLRVIEPLLPFATGLYGFAGEADRSSLPMASGWVLGLPGARLTVTLSPEKARGFSGEGAVLVGLAGDCVEDDADLVSAMLAFEPRIDIDHLSRETALPAQRVADALGVLACSGQVGYDLAGASYFHRPLPLSGAALAVMNPRLGNAEALLAANAVEHQLDGYLVHSGGAEYRVVLGEPDRCTCPWWVKYRGTRGPCKHVLAVRLSGKDAVS